MLLLRTKLSDFLDERRVLVVTPVNGHIFGQPGRKGSEAMHRLCLQVPRHVDHRATLLVPDRGLDPRRYPLIVEALDGMPSGVWPLFKAVFETAGPDNSRFEDPAVGEVPAELCPEDAVEPDDQILSEVLRQHN